MTVVKYKVKKEVTRNLYGATLQGQMTETSFICYWMCTSWVLERCAPQFENHWTNLWMAWSTYYGVDEWRLKMWQVAWRTEIWRRRCDTVRGIVNMSYEGRWQRVAVYPSVSSLQDLKTVKVTYVRFVYVFPPPSTPPHHKLNYLKSLNT